MQLSISAEIQLTCAQCHLITEPMPDTPRHNLTAAEAEALPQFLKQAASVCSRMDFHRLITEDLQAVFPHGSMICGTGYASLDCTAQTFRILNFGFPSEYLELIRAPNGGIDSPILQRWVQDGKPQLYSESDLENDLPADWLDRFKDFKLGNLAAHGFLDRHRRKISYFTFCSMPYELTEHHAFILEILIPSLHAALLRVSEETPPLGV